MTVSVARSFQEVKLDTPAVVSIGTFDGVHRGHRYLLEQARDRAHEHGLALVVITFEPCPAVVLRSDVGRYQISTWEQKLRLLEDLKANLVVLLPFTTELSRLTADEFLDRIEERLDVTELWFGEDFRFGHARGGDLAMLVERSRTSKFSLHVVSRRMEGKESISSSRVRRVIAGGDVEGALPLLGYPFRLACTSVADCTSPGSGSSVPYSVSPFQLLPADGAYAVLASTGARTTAVVVGSGTDAQVALKGAAAQSSLELEFIAGLATPGDYAADPEVWDARGRGLLAEWQRPIYAPISDY